MHALSEEIPYIETETKLNFGTEIDGTKERTKTKKLRGISK